MNNSYLMLWNDWVIFYVPLGHYMLVHSGVDVLPQGRVTTLISPVRRGVTHTECVYFWYNEGGHNPG